ncbi:ATP/GTP-binding protein [uncultured Brachyspira sp.]|uniref:AAA family ATPase n=1 Tax=uncultured Brachyspira sp. TaxID=221953 RepID=UPI00262E8F46|nr:ATP-binding protein [uncultured Brachyspira sp.]
MIKNFEIHDYRQFKNAKFDNFANINLFVGENDTGKTTILKFLYCISYELKNIVNANIRTCNIFKYINNIYTFNNFKFGTSNKPTDKLKKLYLYDENTIHFNSYFLNSKNEIITSDDNINNYNYDYKPLFIPAKEILSIMNAIIYLKNQNIESGFDDSYTDIIYEILARKNIDERELLSVLKNKYDFYNGNIQIDKNTNMINYYKNDGNIYNINITAEGIKKLGIFEVLHNTGNLTKKSILFIDEPENSLHPKMVRELMRFLADISKEGVQIFMASHNSFVLNQLSNIAIKDNYPINVYFFIKEDNYTKIDGAYDLSKEFPDNSISDEAYDMFVESKN